MLPLESDQYEIFESNNDNVSDFRGEKFTDNSYCEFLSWNENINVDDWLIFASIWLSTKYSEGCFIKQLLYERIFDRIFDIIIHC